MNAKKKALSLGGGGRGWLHIPCALHLDLLLHYLAHCVCIVNHETVCSIMGHHSIQLTDNKLTIKWPKPGKK